MSTEITVVNPETGLIGDKQEIAVTVDRIRAMMPIPDDAPQQAVWGLAQVCLALNLNPLAGEAYLAKFNGKYTPIIGTMGYEKKAREQSEFHYEIEPLDEVELNTHRGNLYHEEDYGVRITLWNYKKARECKSIGIPYKPAVSYGFWRKKAAEVTEWDKAKRRRVSTGDWKPDNIPASWTKVMVAEKRAVRNAIKRDFSMSSFEAQAQAMGVGANDEFEARVYEVVDEQHQEEMRRTAPIASRLEPMPDEDENGLIFSTPTDPMEDVKTLDDVEEPAVEEPADPAIQPITESQTKALHAAGGSLYSEKGQWGTKRAELVSHFTQGRTSSSKEMSVEEAAEMISAINKEISKKASESASMESPEVNILEAPEKELG